MKTRIFLEFNPANTHSKERKVRVVGFNINFNNISVILWHWRLVFLVEGVPGENYRPVDGLSKQSVPITSKVVSSNPAHGKVYSIQHYVISLSVTCDNSVDFSRYSRFLHQ